MNILRVIYEGYNKLTNSFADCFILIQERTFSYSLVYDIAVKNGYPICEEPYIDRLIEKMCKEQGGEFWDFYQYAQQKGFSFTKFKDKNISGFNPFKVPRFSENDFEQIFVELGGIKIPESTLKTPDFFLDKIVYELKDIQSESLYNMDRQNKLGEIFQNFPKHFIDLNPEINYREETAKYHQLIKNSIQGHFKKASEQIKAFRQQETFESAGIILLNTGMLSLPHDLLEKFATQILANTNTIEFAFIFSQKVQGSWFDIYANYYNKFIGKLPTNSDKITKSVWKLVEHRMTEMVQGKPFESGVDNMHPISFEANNRVFFWNPGRIISTLPGNK